MKCILADRLYVPEECVTPEHLDGFVYQIGEMDGGYDYGPFESVVGSLRTFSKVRVNGAIYYAFSRGNLSKIGELFGDLPWEDKTSAPPMTYDLQFKGALHTWESKQIGQQEAVATWLKYKSGIVKAPPRFGKTISSIFILTKLKKKTLIVAHQVDLLEQYYNSFVKFTNIDDVRHVNPKQKARDATGRVVGFFQDYDNPEELDVCLLCWQTLASKKNGAERLLKYGSAWGTVIVDECHPYDTAVLVDYDKYMSIGEIYENPNITHVLSYDLESKKIEKKRIIERRCNESDKPRVAIRIKGDRGLAVVSPTENHKYYVVGKGYIEAKDLTSGDKLITYAGDIFKATYCKVEGCYELFTATNENPASITHYVEVVAVTKIVAALKDRRVYNLEVEGNHNYFVVAKKLHNGRVKKTPTIPVLVSNCHKVGGTCYARTVNRLSARYRLGLTGTVERVDGREFLLHDIIGPVVAEGRVATIPCSVVVTHTGIPIKYSFTEPLPYLYKRLYNNKDRMEAILADLEKDVEAGRYICFAFHRCSVAQLCHWTDKLKGLGIKAESFYGSCKDREGVLERARSGETQVLVCNSQMLTGIDVPRWNVYYSAFPTSNIVFNEDGKLSGNFYQEFSRIRTPFTYEDGTVKTEGIIRDYVDNNSLCFGMYKKRYRAYTNQQFKISIVKLEQKTALTLE